MPKGHFTHWMRRLLLFHNKTTYVLYYLSHTTTTKTPQQPPSQPPQSLEPPPSWRSGNSRPHPWRHFAPASWWEPRASEHRLFFFRRGAHGDVIFLFFRFLLDSASGCLLSAFGSFMCFWLFCSVGRGPLSSGSLFVILEIQQWIFHGATIWGCSSSYKSYSGWSFFIVCCS